MANFKTYWPTLVEWEGAEYEDVEGDSGGPTKFGVILREWVQSGYDKDGDGDIDKFDLMKINSDDAIKIAKKHYWDQLKGDLINSQSVAEILVDAAYNQGLGYTTPMIQKLVKVTPDGIFGNGTLSAINACDPTLLFSQIKQARISRYTQIVQKYPKNQKFLKGWMNRISSFKYIT